jgi:hypothetical protein
MPRPSYSRFLPGIPTAPGSNRNLVNDPHQVNINNIRIGDGASVARTREHVLEALLGLHQKNLLAETIKTAGMNRHANMRLPSDLESWQELRENTGAWLARHIAHMTINKQSAKDQLGMQTHALRAASEGSATSIAFQEVIPHVLADYAFEDPNADIAGWARRSKGFIIGWLGIHLRVDGPLVYALAREKSLPSSELYDDLRFDPNLFTAVDDVREVRLDPDRIATLRSRDVRRSPQSYQDPNEALFGCPAADFIPLMYDAQVAAAEASGLFGQTYEDTRSIRS